MLLINIQGGWEVDETMIQAAYRETYEEAGVLGIVEVASKFLFNFMYSIASR